MRCLSWALAGLLCLSAVAQQPQTLSPISAGIVFDTSGSMGDKIEQSRQVAAHFFKTSHQQDEFFLVQSSDRPTLISGFNPSTAEIQNHLASTQARGRSGLLDSIYLALQQTKKARNPRRALLVISDGGENNSRYVEGEIKNLVREAGIPIYAIGVYEWFGNRGRTAEELSGPNLLHEIAVQSGGHHFAVGNAAELPDIAAKAGTGMRAGTQP